MREDLFIQSTGTGTPIVWLHGMPSPPSEFDRLVSELNGYRSLVVHLPGYGRSAHQACHGISGTTQRVEAALTRHNVERPILVGYSMGAFRAALLASRMKPRALIMLAPLVDLDEEERSQFHGFATALRAGADLEGTVAERFVSKAHRERAPADAARVGRWIHSVAPEALAKELTDVANAPSLTALAETEGWALACPVLIRVGSEDVAMPTHHGRAALRLAPHAELQVAEGMGHALVVEDHEATVAALRSFLSGLGEGRDA
jgi:pimeloyl-ACP methyl ester carboxylesterase